MKLPVKPPLAPLAAQPGALPCSSSPTLQLVHPTPLEKQQTWLLNGSAWRAALSLPSYLHREAHLARQSLCLDRALTFWILVDSADVSDPRVILASCETIRKPALVARGTQGLEEVVSHAIGAVFCRDEYRGRGYAGRMMDELGKILETWQQHGERRSRFNVLYSDIGKHFYAKRGWLPHPSSHISLPQGPNPSVSMMPHTRPLFAGDMVALCGIDEALLRKGMQSSSSRSALCNRVAMVATAETMQWHHAREEFTAKNLGRGIPHVKGALQGSNPGSRVWAIWTRTFGKVPRDNVLHILRIVIEDTQIRDMTEQEGRRSQGLETSTLDRRLLAVVAVLQKAREEAMEWDMRRVEIWNPSFAIQRAAKTLVPEAAVAQREQESIPSLKWYGEENEVEWLINEKFAWY